MLLSHKIAVAAAALALAAPGLAAADTYTLADFSGGIFGGNANAQAPFNLAGIHQGMSLSGSFLIDDDIAPASSGFDNIQYASYPDAAAIPPSIAFNFNIGTLNFTAAQDTGLAATQYKDGAFHGFAYSDDFTFQNVGYNLSINGGTFSIYALADPFQSQLVGGFINIGDNNVTGREPFTPPPPTSGGGGCDVNGAFGCGGGSGAPEPQAWALMILGFGGVGAVLRQRRRLFEAA
jgi:hypothetical protein